MKTNILQVTLFLDTKKYSKTFSSRDFAPVILEPKDLKSNDLISGKYIYSSQVAISFPVTSAFHEFLNWSKDNFDGSAIPFWSLAFHHLFSMSITCKKTSDNYEYYDFFIGPKFIGLIKSGFLCYASLAEEKLNSESFDIFKNFLTLLQNVTEYRKCLLHFRFKMFY